MLFAALSLFLVLDPYFAKARDVSRITDWYIKDFQSEIIVNKDSSLNITETIVADCGNLPDKHGIFRTIPTFYQKSAGERVSTPVKLLSIAGPEGQPIKYSSIKNSDSVTWKIGDPNKTVTGQNTYVIRYLVQNAIRFNNPGFDEFYWNLNGNYWEIQTDVYKASIIFPSEINNSSAAKEVNIYSGSTGSKTSDLADYVWTNGNTLEVTSARTLLKGEGITASVTLPKGIFTPYKPPLAQKLMVYLIIILPLSAFVVSFYLWSKYGRDPKLGKTEMVQYEPPLNLTPMELGTLYGNGYFRTNYISAAMIDLAVKKIIRIEEIPKKGIFGSKDFRLILLDRTGLSSLTKEEQTLINEIFGSEDKIELSDLQNKFYKSIPILKNKVMDALKEKKLFSEAGFTWQILLSVFALIIGVAGFMLLSVSSYLGVGLILSGAIFLFFSFLMRRRTEEGAEALWQTRGFKLYLSKAEKYRQQFYEKENIFEKFLPYAMVFGITGLWISNMKKIYGEEYFNSYHPYWYTGYAFAHFDANSFEKSINSLSSSMVSTMASNPSSSGAGGGGFSGGGGGGGGGGGW